MLRTTDGGRSWTPQVLSAEQVIGIAAAGSQTGFATLGNPGQIVFTYFHFAASRELTEGMIASKAIAIATRR